MNNDLRNAAQDAFDEWADTYDCDGNEWQDMGANDYFIKGYEIGHAAALVQPQQEPVAWGMRHPTAGFIDCITPEEHESYEGEYTTPLYTSPQPAKWVGLTDDEIDEAFIFDLGGDYYKLWRQECYRAIEAALRRKNHGTE